jgi:uncharacterized protein with von Willebrand factor type A (vWA) domain
VPGLVHNLLVFGRLLRRLGLEVHVGRLLDVVAALPHVDLGARDEVFHTCRSLLVYRHEDLPLFDRAFDAFWRKGGVESIRRGLKPPPSVEKQGEGSVIEGGGFVVEGGGFSPHQNDLGVLRTWSDAGALAAKDFADFTPEDVALAHVAMERLVWQPGVRRTRRWTPGRGSRVDLRRALARSVRSGGDLVVLPRRRRRTRPRPVVLLCDVSGSMARYSRMLVQFAHALARRHRRVEAFLFSTGLTRITLQLRARSVARGMA